MQWRIENLIKSIDSETQAKRFKFDTETSVTLDTINDDCLFHIWQYLGIYESLNLDSTCRRLHTFANEFIFPKVARQVEIRLTANIFFYLDDHFTEIKESNMTDLENFFKSFGTFVKYLTLTGSTDKEDDIFQTQNLRIFEKLLNLCPNLHSLCMNSVEFSSDDVHMLKNVPSQLKELHLVQCSGITDDWSEELLRFSKLERITLTGPNATTSEFFKNNHLSSLTIGYKSCMAIKELETIFNQNFRSLLQLEIFKFSTSPDYRNVATLIDEKLPNLQMLTIEDDLSVALTNSLTEYPHLKSLKVMCYGEHKNVNALLRKLSDVAIEDLVIINGAFDTEDPNESPLVFNKLRSLQLKYNTTNDVTQIIQAMTKVQMPAVTSFDIEIEKYVHELLTLFKSKNTLKTFTVKCYFNLVDQLSFLHNITEILKLNWRQLYLNMPIRYLEDRLEAVSKFTN